MAGVLRGTKPLELVDAADRVDHPLPGEHWIGKQVAEARERRGSTLVIRDGTEGRLRTGDPQIHNLVL